MRSFIKKILAQLRRSLGITDLANDQHAVRDTAAQMFVTNELTQNLRYKNPKHLNHFEHKIFSQFGEDGIIWEIFQRTYTTNRYFVEIGVEATENNSLHLLLNGWRGVWIEGNPQETERIKTDLHAFVQQKRLAVQQSFVTRENIAYICTKLHVLHELDFLSVDIDGNDYWVLSALLKKYQPRVICVEYNAFLGAEIEWAMPYNASYVHQESTHYGASLAAYVKLLKSDYVLVACSLAGTNAFFVRKDAAGKKFMGPYTAATFFQPPRFWLYQKSLYPITSQMLQDLDAGQKAL